MSPTPKFLLGSFKLGDQRPQRFRSASTYLFGRYGIYHGLGAFNIGPGSRVLVPSFICRVAADAVQAAGAAVDYYAVDEQLRPDFADLVSRITPATRAVMVVHYFGFIQPLQDFQDICSRNKLLLIEDAAHVFPGPWTSAGSTGDFSIFSWRKFLPVSDGSDLVFSDERQVPGSDPPLGLTVRSAKHVVDEWGQDGNFVTGILDLAKKIRPKAAHVSGAQGSLKIESSSVDFEDALSCFSSTSVSRFVRAHVNVQEMYEVRRRNYTALVREISQLGSTTKPVLPILADDVCPLHLPVLSEAPMFHRHLRQHGVPAVAWDDVIPPGVNLAEFPAARKLYSHLFFLPIHQGLSEHDMRVTAQVIAAVQNSKNVATV